MTVGTVFKFFAAFVAMTCAGVTSLAQNTQPDAAKPAVAKQPNILILWGDDIGTFNISAYNLGMMGYKTPNIDSIAKEGALFTDWYGQQSCTAGRAAFITGQSPIRTGLLKIGMPGGKDGLSSKDPSLAELLKPLGYMTGQFGKNHLGDLNEHLPTVHGFDEFYGNLYHLNAEEEPENADYPKDPAFKKQFGPRGVIESFASDKDDPTVDGRNGKIGKQTVRDTGPLTKKRMETVDEEVTAKAMDFMERAKKADKPFLCWYNTTRMHVNTHLKAESVGKTGLGVAADGMVEHDFSIGQMLNKLKELGLEENTIVMYSTDNGNEFCFWPDGGTSIFRGEKNTSWEGGFRVPCMIRWPGVIKPGTVINEICAHEDMIPTLLAAAGDANIKEDLLKGKKYGETTFRVHLDGYNLLPALKGGGNPTDWPRKEFLYWTDGGSVAAIRYENWKASFLRQDAHGLHVWIEPFTELRAPMLTNLRMDPMERAQDEASGYDEWYKQRMFMITPSAALCAKWIESFREFPPRMKPGSFSLDRVMEAVTSPQGGTK